LIPTGSGTEISFKTVTSTPEEKTQGLTPVNPIEQTKQTDEQLKSLTGMTSEQLNNLTDEDFSSLFETTEHGFMDGVRSNGIYKLFFTSAS
jgi:hypothetical protein